MTIELCCRYPRLRAVALEPLEAARRRAERNVAKAGRVYRVEVRAGRIEDLDAEEAFDLVWLPGNFLGPELLPAALTTVRRALRPGGYVVNAVPRQRRRRSACGQRPPARGAVGRDTVEPERVARWLEDAGFCEVVLMPRLPNGLGPMRARRPPTG